jgi:hypothetical protein
VAERNPETGRFEKGHKKLGGERLGNVRSLDVRSVIAGAVDKLGGINRLVKWVNADKLNERIFWSEMYMKLLPLQVHNSGPGAVVLINPEDLDRAIEERGLPVSMFGRDAPVLELSAEEVGNGKSNGQDTEVGLAQGDAGKEDAGNGRDDET